jgi:hypothetical protein
MFVVNMEHDKCNLSWDSYSIIKGVVEDIKQNPEDFVERFEAEGKDINNENDIWHMAEAELIDWDWEYECMTDNLTDIMQTVSKRYVAGDIWKVSGESMGWRGREGFKYAKAENGLELLREILPETDCTFFIYIEKGKRGIKIYNYHHDTRFNSRGYELYYIHPLTRKERVEYFNGDY